MATYVIFEEINITRQEGDTADVVFTVPSVIDLSTFTEIKFQVKNVTTLISKSLTLTTLSVSGQTITIPLLVADTKSKSGQHRWELEISSESETITIGRGNFTVIKELIV